MSFIDYKRQISLGDRVIIYLQYGELQPLLISKDAVHQTKYGAIKHNLLIGKSFGSKLKVANGYVYLLHPTAELWTMALRHRTQILYSVDISEIIFRLDIHPGSVVVEAGTGSGSLSHSILRSIHPSGHLHTFDFHAGRVNEARTEFLLHGFNSNLVTIKQRDVCAEGFDLHPNCVDSVFLDLPSPWLAIPHAAKVLVEGGRICCFSPCIEQVQRSYESLQLNNFSDIATIECINRELNIRESTLTLPDLGFNNANRTFDNINYEGIRTKKVNKNLNLAIEDNSFCTDQDSEININQFNISKENIDEMDTSNKDYKNNDELKISRKENADNLNNEEKNSLTFEQLEINNKIYFIDCIDNGTVSNVSEKSQCLEADYKLCEIESKSEAEPKKMKNNSVAKLNSKFMNKNKCEYNLTTLSPGLKITGHTGYLTFATLYPN